MDYSCLVAIANGGSDSQPYVLGDALIRNFYTTFDFNHKRIHFATSSNAPAGVAVGRDFQTLVIICIVLGVILGVALLALIAMKFYQCYKNKKKNAGVQIGTNSGV